MESALGQSLLQQNVTHFDMLEKETENKKTGSFGTRKDRVGHSGPDREE
jgi:hypothetical protein